MIAQARLGPGRIHHCMRAIGAAERALEADVRARASRASPSASRSPSAGNIQDWIAESRIEIEMARLLTLKAAWLMDTVGNRQARIEIAAIKVAAPERRAEGPRPRDPGARRRRRLRRLPARLGCTPHLRTLRLADGPDEVHKLSIARRELRRHT